MTRKALSVERLDVRRLADADAKLLAEAIEDGERVKWRAKFEDMGYEDCETCRQARLRAAFAEDSE
jgi:hypothetical protein